MKKYIIGVFALVTLFSCHSDSYYEDLNIDPKNPSEVSENFLFTSATVSLFDQMNSISVNTNIFSFFAQYLTTTTYIDEPNYDLTNRNIPQSHWRELYNDVIFDLQNAKDNTNANEELTDAEKSARIGQIEVLEVYAWSVLVDSFGDIPYTEAINASEITLPVYDDAATIYSDLISRLNAVQTNLSSSGTGFTDSDVIYGGDLNKWSKFANSLLLRLGLRLQDVNPSASADAISAAVSGGVFESNDDNAIINYQSSTPNTNPKWLDLVQSGRSDFVAANTLVDYMNDLEDPRRAYYFDDNLGDDTYEGGTYGDSNSYPLYTHFGDAFLDPTHPGILLDYAEVEFNLAAAAQANLGGVTGAEDHYESAITASILYAGLSQTTADDYLAQSDVAYDGTQDQLALQFWIAMFDNSFEGWSVWRLYDAPELNTPADTGLPVPLRYTYPVNEQNLNTANYDAAATAIGGDIQQTPLFWDVQ